ncbi:MAG: zf-HC2 domain-containing protein [Burkholderiaceae bacterium]
MTGQIVHLEPDPHVAVQQLLPWYVTDRLAPAERAQVDAHVANCAECRTELEAERQWQAGPVKALLQADAGTAPGDVEQGWARMRALLGDGVAAEGDGNARPAAASSAAASPAAASSATRRRPARAGRSADARAAGPRRRADAGRAWPGGRPPARAWIVPGLLSAALAVALVATLRLPTPAPRTVVGATANATGEYHALGAAAEDDATAVVRFRPEATEAQIRRSLRDCGARLVDGPTVTDAYVVRLPRERYTAALEALRRAPAVALVEALDSVPPR